MIQFTGLIFLHFFCWAHFLCEIVHYHDHIQKSICCQTIWRTRNVSKFCSRTDLLSKTSIAKALSWFSFFCSLRQKKAGGQIKFLIKLFQLLQDYWLTDTPHLKQSLVKTSLFQQSWKSLTFKAIRSSILYITIKRKESDDNLAAISIFVLVFKLKLRSSFSTGEKH